jgi:glycosyltransferase involved in cell wall biosynthesis
MNIAYIITRSDAIGGAAIHVRDLAVAMRQKGHEATVVVGGTGMFADVLRSSDVPFVTVPSLHRRISPVADMRAYAEVRRALVALRPDLVSTHSSKAGLLGRLAAKSLHIPSIFTAHGWAFSEGTPAGLRRRVYRMSERAGGSLSELVVTVSEYDRALAVREHVADAARVRVILNGVHDVDPAMRSRQGTHAPRMVMVGRFERQKDHAALLHAASSLKDLPWELDLVGDGPLRPAIEALIRELDLTGRIRLHGYSPDVAELLRQAQLFVLATHWEGLPRSIIEAMRASLPVVANSVGGVRELVSHGETGLVVAPGDVAGLAAALRGMLEDGQMRARMGEAGRARYESLFTFERMLDETMDMYEDVMSAVHAA